MCNSKIISSNISSIMFGFRLNMWKYALENIF